MKPISIVMLINAAAALILFLVFWVLFSMPRIGMFVNGAVGVGNLALAGVFAYSREKSMRNGFLVGFLFMAALTAAMFWLLYTFFPAELDMFHYKG